MIKKPSQLVQDFVNCMVWCNSSSFIGFLVFCTASDCISRSYWDHVTGPWSKRSALFDLHCACYFIKWLSIWMPTWCSLTKFHGNVMSRHEFLGHAACLWGTWAVAEDGQECHRRLTRCRRQADEWMHCNQQPLAIDIQWFTAFLGNDPLERCNMFVVQAKFKLSSCICCFQYLSNPCLPVSCEQLGCQAPACSTHHLLSNVIRSTKSRIHAGFAVGCTKHIQHRRPHLDYLLWGWPIANPPNNVWHKICETISTWTILTLLSPKI